MTSPSPPTTLEEEMRPELDEALMGLDELAHDNANEALTMFDTLPSPVQALPDFQLVLARTHQALGMLEKARDLSLGVIEIEEARADAHHLLADLLEDLGDTPGANRHFLRTLQLDRESFERDSEIPPEELFSRLQQVLKNTCSQLPEERLLESDVQLLPSAQEVEKGLDPRALTSWRPPREDTASTRPGHLTLYAANLDAEFGDLQEFEEFAPQVQRAIQDELADHLSLSREEINSLGWQNSEPAHPDKDG